LPAKKTVVHKPTAAELDHAIVHIQPIPQVALKIIRTIQSEEFDLRDIARQIRHDQVISANVIRMCNTAYISPQLEIQSIDHALLILGVKRVVQFVLSSVMSRFFDCSIHGYALSKGGLYHHAVSTAIVAEQISQLTRRAEPDTAYTAGLLHDIGKVLLDQFVASALPLFYAQMISEGEHLLNVERSLLGITHIEAGSRLAELWDFPLWLKDVIAYHDRPELAQHNRDLAHVIYLADLLISRFNAGYDLDVIETSSLPVRLRYLDLDPASLAELIGRIPWKILDTPGYF
jgi:putative nucleotidyltransferase with HDIG domain